MVFKQWIALFCVLVVAYTVSGAEGKQINLIAIFDDKAYIKIDDKRYILKPGEEAPGGIKLISAQGNRAVVVMDGQKRLLKLGIDSQGNIKEVNIPRTQVRRDKHGVFITTGKINGKGVVFIVDTGASVVSISERKARELGLSYDDKNNVVTIDTASGKVAGFPLILESVTVNDMELTQVKAVIIQSAGQEEILLGGSALEQIKITQESDIMYLEKKY